MWNSISPVELMVQRACDPSLPEPNYAVNLELVEHIKQKKANTPREAAMAIVRNVNNRNPHVSLLALNLLNTLVGSLGHLFHLQIATKEFLNELVRRFPERPPPFPGPIMTRILEMIHEWKETLCKESRWKEDLANIKDMHRLLGYKGYRFRDLSRSRIPQPSTSANANLKSPEELEEEDRAAQSAKLQELIRRGTPRDLAAAQELMKTLSGANPDAKPDYRKETMHELEKLQAKVILLNELLDNFDSSKGEKFVQGDAYDQVADVCRQARPRIQKWIGEAEEGDPESLDTFLHINDMINTVLDRYERYQKGDYSAVPETSAPKPDLIDFFGEDTAPNAPAPQAVNDLDGLFGPAPVTSAPVPGSSSSDPRASIMAAFGQPAPQYGGAPNMPPNLFSGTPNFNGQAQSSFRSSTPGSAQGGSIALPSTPRPGSAAPPQTQQPPTTQAAKDPFADLAGLF